MSEATKSQEFRTLALYTPLGDDKLLLMDATGTEELGRLFQFDLELHAEAPVAHGDILSKNVTMRLGLRNDETRYFNGYISRFSLVYIDESTPEKKIYHYRAEMVPALWFLTRHSDCRIFQNKTVPDIIKQVMSDRGVKYIRANLTGTYRSRENCVQYRETDFNFISRLMEDEGIYYYFEHEDGKHTVVLCDATTAHKATANTPSLHFDTPDPGTLEDYFIWDWTLDQKITPNKYALNDFDPLQPKTSLLSPADIKHDHDPMEYEIYEYPGGYVTADEGKHYATVRIEEIEAGYEIATGTSNARELYAGCLFTLEDHPVFDGDYIVTAIQYQLHNDEMGSDGAAGRPEYRCRITCIPKRPFRAARTTPKPMVQGPQTAKVTTPSGQELHCDKYGRVKIKFHWDRAPDVNEKSSCWVRVSQPLAGKKWGFVSIPRKGQEVIVEFLEGDPDRPIITGRVFNADQMPPYELPANATMTSFKSNAKTGGNFNEFRLEDKDNAGQLYMFAGHNYDLRVKNNRYETVENNMHVTVSNNHFLSILGEDHVAVGADRYEEIGKDLHVTIAGKEVKTVAGLLQLVIGGNEHHITKGNHQERTDGSYSLNVSGKAVIQSAASITLKVGASSITMDPSGITIKTPKLELKGDNEIDITSKKITATADVSFTAKGATAEVSASGAATFKAGGNTTIKGAAVLIN